MFSGWEMDSTGYVVDFDGKNRIVLTSHGMPYLPTKEEIQEKIEEYEKASQPLKEFI